MLPPNKQTKPRWHATRNGKSLFSWRNHLVGPHSFQIQSAEPHIALLFLLFQYLLNVVLPEDHIKMKIWIQ